MTGPTRCDRPYAVRALDGRLLAPAATLPEAQAVAARHAGRACVVHAAQVVHWAPGVRPHDRAAAAALLRRLGLAPARWMPPAAAAAPAAAPPPPTRAALAEAYALVTAIGWARARALADARRRPS